MRFAIGGISTHQNQMATRRTTDQTYPGTVNAKPLRVPSDETNTGRNVGHCAWMSRVAAIAEIERKDVVAMLRERLTDNIGRTSVVCGPSASVHHDDRVRAIVSGTIEVQFQPVATGPTVGQRLRFHCQI